MKINHLTITTFAISAVAASAQPSINANGIVNAASYSIPGLPNSSIAQGSIFAIFGTNLGPSTLQEAGAFPLPTNLGGTSVTIKSGSQTFQAPIIYSIATQVAAILPSTVPVGPVSATVSYQNSASNPQTFNVATSSFGIFAVNQQGSGTGVLTNANYQPFLPTYAALPGDVVILWGTGLGPISTPDGNGPSPGNLTNIPAQVFVGSTAVT